MGLRPVGGCPAAPSSETKSSGRILHVLEPRRARGARKASGTCRWRWYATAIALMSESSKPRGCEGRKGPNERRDAVKPVL